MAYIDFFSPLFQLSIIETTISKILHSQEDRLMEPDSSLGNHLCSTLPLGSTRLNHLGRFVVCASLEYLSMQTP